MKIEILYSQDISPGILYLVPKFLRCKKCGDIIHPENGWKCTNCSSQWSLSDFASYFGKIILEDEPFVLRKLCDDCTIGSLEEQIRHRIIVHDAEYNKTQKTIRYRDHLLDIIPPNIR